MVEANLAASNLQRSFMMDSMSLLKGGAMTLYAKKKEPRQQEVEDALEALNLTLTDIEVNELVRALGGQYTELTPITAADWAAPLEHWLDA